CCCVADCAKAQLQYRTAALSGQAAPGAPPGVRYGVFEPPVINDAGDVGYRVFLHGSFNMAIYGGPSAAPQLIARGDGAAPVTPGGVYYAGSNGNQLGMPVLSDADHAAYVASLYGSGTTSVN